MQILFLNTLGTWVLDILAWIIFHLGIGFTVSRFPVEKFDPAQRFYQTFRWEQGGEIYQKLFRVRLWKRFIPQGSKLFGEDNFSLQHLKSLDPAYLESWLRESVRAEFCHWSLVLPGFFFFLWNPPEMGWLMVAYAALNNFFPIVAQRFNRPRVRRCLALVKRYAKEKKVELAGGEGYYELAGSAIS